MTIGSVPELISAVSILFISVFVVHLLIKLGRLIDRYMEEINKK